MTALRDSLCHIRHADNLCDQVAAMASALGFRSFMLGYVNPSLSSKTFWVDNMPARTWDSTAVVCRDPVAAEIVATKESKTILWTGDTYAKAGAGDLWELGNSVGIHNGVARLACLGGKRRMMMSMDRDVPFDGTPAQEAALIGEFVTFSEVLAGTVVSIFDIQGLIEHDLTAKELEALKWVFAHGYTEYQVSEQLNVSFTDARRILRHATEKIGAGSYLQAAMIAARHGALGAA